MICPIFLEPETLLDRCVFSQNQHTFIPAQLRIRRNAHIELQDDHAIMEVTIPPEWMNRTIGEINIRKKYNINILALKKDGKLDMSITPDTQLCRDESMLVLGKYASIQKCFRL